MTFVTGINKWKNLTVYYILCHKAKTANVTEDDITCAAHISAVLAQNQW